MKSNFYNNSKPKELQTKIGESIFLGFKRKSMKF
jgi:hypothetical protein